MSQAQFSMEMATPENDFDGDGEVLDDMEERDQDIDLNGDLVMDEGYARLESSITYSATLSNQRVVNGDDRFHVIYTARCGTQVPAVFHDQIRAELIAEAKEGGAYTHKPTEGTEAADITAFHADQRHWEEIGAGRPELLKVFAKPPNFADPKYNPGFMYFDGFLVIDHTGQPLRPYQGIPLTLSSKIEGWRAEAIRRADPRIRNIDLLARMPVKVEPSANGIPKRTPLVKENTVAGRQSRFREGAGAVTWGKGGARNVYNFLWALLPQHCKENNLALPRELTQQERGQLLELNVGKKPERARKEKTDKGMTREQYIEAVHTRATRPQRPRGGNPRRLHKEAVRGQRAATAETQRDSAMSPPAESALAEDDAALPDSPTSGLVEERVQYQATSPAPTTPAATPTAIVAPAIFTAPVAPVAFAAPFIPAAPVATAVLVAPIARMVPITIAGVPAADPALAPLLPLVPRPSRHLTRGPIDPPFPFVRPGEYLFDETRMFC